MTTRPGAASAPARAGRERGGSAVAAPPGLEPAPFPVRIQRQADLDAARWGLLAWEDPDADDSPFWSDAPMLGCTLAAGEGLGNDPSLGAILSC